MWKIKFRFLLFFSIKIVVKITKNVYFDLILIRVICAEDVCKSDSIDQLVFEISGSQFEKHSFEKNAFKVFRTDYIEIILLTINQLVRGHRENLPVSHKIL